jgi:hypothetical protein
MPFLSFFSKFSSLASSLKSMIASSMTEYGKDASVD